MKLFLKTLGVVAAIFLIILAVSAAIYFPGHNMRTLDEGRFLGSRQMNAVNLEHTIGTLDVRTVINLRGENPGSDWYDAEVAVCKKKRVPLHSFAWSKNKIPDPESLARYINVIETGTPPFLAHCQGGTHRTGVAAAVYLLLKGKDVATARKQFGPMFLNAPIGKLLDLYEGSGMPFKQWALEVYPGVYAELQKKPAPAGDAPAPAPAAG